MPFLTLLTSLSRPQLPSNVMPLLSAHVANVLNKPPAAINWVLETDKAMSKGPDNEGKPFTWLKIESIGVFAEADNCKKFTPLIFDFFTKELKMPQDQVLVTLYDLEAFRVGKDSMTMEELRAKK